MVAVAKFIDGKLKLAEVEKPKYFVEKLLDSDNYGIYDSANGKCLILGNKKMMQNQCYKMNKR